MNDIESTPIAAAQRGDPHAQRRLFLDHARPVYRICFRVLGDSALAEDATQETFVQVFRHLGDFDGRASLAHWIHSIARNAALALVRRGALRESAMAHDDVELRLGADHDPAIDPLRGVEGDELREQVGVALARLTTIERTAFVLRHVEHESLARIAAQVGSNPNAIKQALFRGVRKLRAALAPAFEETS